MAAAQPNKYEGNGGNEQRVLIKEAKVGWKAVVADPTRQVSIGFTQFDYLETLGAKLAGQARRLLDNYVDKWDCTNVAHVNNPTAVDREIARQIWRNYYKEKAIYDLGQVQNALIQGARVPIDPVLDTVVTLEPPDLEEFLKIIEDTFQAASAIYLDDLKNFKPVPRETLLKLADRFDEVAQPLLTAGLMTSRGLALTLRRHLPAHIRKSTISAMLREDKKRTRGDLPLLD